MQCPNVIYQVGVFTSVAGVPQRIAKCSGGAMEVLEIVIQPQANAHIQFFEGLPNAGGSNPISLYTFVQQYQMWSKPARVVKDDIYMVVDENAVVLSTEVRSIPL